MKAILKAVASFYLSSSIAYAEDTIPFSTPAKPEASDVKCIQTIDSIHNELKVKGAVLITQMMNPEVFVRVYEGRLDTDNTKRYLLLVMAIKTNEQPNGVTRVACTRETDGAKFHLLRLAYPITDEEA